MKSKLFRIIVLISFTFKLLTAQSQKQTVEFAHRDSAILKMDIYTPAIQADTAVPAVVFVFGGGFYAGSRSYTGYLPYFNFLRSNGYVVAAIDYRLGLKGIKKAPSLFNRKPLIHAIEIAVEDTYAATLYLLQHARELNIDTNRIILSGSSAGAITILQTDYEKRNNFEASRVLPSGFQYAGLISFAGSIYSKEGKPDYAVPAPPTLLFHGSKDNIVPYNKIALFGTGMYGSKSLAKKRHEDNAPYAFYTFEGIGHDVALFPMLEYQAEIQNFIQDFVIKKRPLFIDVNIKDENRKNHLTVNLGTLMQQQH